MRPVGRRRGANRVVLASLVAKRRTGSRFWRFQSAWVGERGAARMAARSPAAAPMSRAAGGRRGQFPSEQAALKVLYLAVRNLEEFRRPNVGIRSSGWKQALQAFTIYFEGRIRPHENRHDHLHRRSDAPFLAAGDLGFELGSWLGAVGWWRVREWFG